MADRPRPERDIDEPLVRALLHDQFPSWADRPLRLLSRGWDNTSWRLGHDLVVRMPHRHVAAELIENEQRWLPAIAELVTLSTPEPVGCGLPTSDYPWSWSIVPWIPGIEAAGAELRDPHATAEAFGRFLRELHVDAPTDAPRNPVRGCPLEHRRQSATEAARRVEAAIECGDLSLDVDPNAVLAVFNDAAALEPSKERVWLHGDLHLRNLVVDQGELTAVIDWGDVCAGDRATDLAGAYMLVPDHVPVVQDHAGAEAAAWQRGRGWAANFALVYLANSDDDPVMHRVGAALARSVLAAE